MTTETFDLLDDLVNRKFTLQRDVLHSWNELQKIKLKHDALVAELNRVREQIKCETEPSLWDQLFSPTGD